MYWVEYGALVCITIFNSFAQDIAEAKEFLKQRGVDVDYDWRLSLMALLKNQGDFQTVSILYDQNLRYKLDYKLSVKFDEVRVCEQVSEIWIGKWNYSCRICWMNICKSYYNLHMMFIKEKFMTDLINFNLVE